MTCRVCFEASAAPRAFQALLKPVILPTYTPVWALAKSFSSSGSQVGRPSALKTCWYFAQKIGMRTVLVRTGKFRPDDLEHTNIVPDGILSSIAHLPDWLEENS